VLEISLFARYFLLLRAESFAAHAKESPRMKKALAILVFALAPALMYAEFQLGGTGMYDGDVTALGSQQITAGDFAYGLETRFKFLSVLQLGLTGMYYMPSFVGGSSYILALTDVGLSIDLFFLRFGAGIGPDFFIPMSGPAVTATSAANLKFSGDINIGSVAIGVIGFYPVQSIWDLQNVTRMKPWVGLTAMIRLF
jgi:hypothetical protein